MNIYRIYIFTYQYLVIFQEFLSKAVFIQFDLSRFPSLKQTKLGCSDILLSVACGKYSYSTCVWSEEGWRKRRGGCIPTLTLSTQRAVCSYHSYLISNPCVCEDFAISTSVFFSTKTILLGHCPLLRTNISGNKTLPQVVE